MACIGAQTLSRSHIIQLKTQLQCIKKGAQSISEFIQRIKTIFDNLTVAACAVDDKDLIIHTLDGLPPKYAPFMISIQTRSSPIFIEELHVLLSFRNSTLSLSHNHSQITFPLLFSYSKTQLVTTTAKVASPIEVEVGGVEKVVLTTVEEGVLTINLGRIFKINLDPCSEEFAAEFAIGLVTLHSIVIIEWIAPIRVVIHLLS